MRAPRAADKGRPARAAPPAVLTPAEAAAAARAAGLRYVSDAGPGIRRRRTGKGITFTGLDGRPVRDRSELARIRSLAIPPAWTDVWICPNPKGHIQATGRDARGRKQYRYHPLWHAVRDDAKYERMLAFGAALPRIRARVEADLALAGLPRAKVLAAVVRLLETTLIRVGNEEYARTNGSFGLTTMRDGHVTVTGSSLRFEFRGKSGVEHRVGLRDRRLARIVRRCQELPGEVLFQYLDEQGERQTVGSADVNAYLREAAGEEFTAKDFRTWAGTVLAAQLLRTVQEVDSEAAAKAHVVRAIEAVAERLGNTPSVCRKCYVHPAVVEAFLDGSLPATLRDRVADEAAALPDGLGEDEAALIRLLHARLTRTADSPARRSA